MKLNYMIFWTTVLLLIAGSWAGNIWYHQSMQLTEPLFLKHNITINGGQGEMIEFIYLDNKNSTNRVTDVQIKQLPQLEFEIHESITYTHQVVMKATAEWKPDEAGQDNKVPFTIKEVTVYDNEGLPREVPIGEINVIWNSGEGILNFSSGSSSSSGTGSYAVNVTKPVTLMKIDYTFSEKLKPWFKLEVLGHPVDTSIYPMRLVQGDHMTFTYQWSIPDNEPAAVEVYKPKIMLHFLMEDGRTVIEDIPINYNLNMSDRQIKRLVRSGGEYL